MSGLNRASDIVVVQENKQTRRDDDPCASPCTSGALCLFNSSNTRVCACSLERIAVSSTDNRELTCQLPACSLDCNLGVCVTNERGVATCQCPPMYDGERCERFRCSGYCRNKGVCYPDSFGKFNILVNLQGCRALLLPTPDRFPRRCSRLACTEM